MEQTERSELIHGGLGEPWLDRGLAVGEKFATAKKAKEHRDRTREEQKERERQRLEQRDRELKDTEEHGIARSAGGVGP